MPIKLIVFTQSWKCPKKGFPDECIFPKEFSRQKLDESFFPSYVKLANWLDKNKKYKNKVMIARPPKPTSLKSIRRVVFDGVDTWVENYGHV